MHCTASITAECLAPFDCMQGCHTDSHKVVMLTALFLSKPMLPSSYSTSQKNFRRAAECVRPLRAANHRLLTPSGNGGERQIAVIFTPRAVLDPMLQTMMDPGTSLQVIPLHESQVTAARVMGGNSCLHCAYCTPVELSRYT